MSQDAKIDDLRWYNFRTGQHDNGPVDGDYSPYVSQDQPAQAIYRIKIKRGATPQEAALYVRELYAKSEKMTLTNDAPLCPCDDECVCSGCTVTGAADVDDEPVDPILCWQDTPPPMDLSDVNPDTWVAFPRDTSPDDAAALLLAVMGGDNKWMARFKARLGG